jgi:superfamily II DNA or RNA helicase
MARRVAVGQTPLFPAVVEEDPFRITLRWYQQDAVEEVFKGWQEHTAVLLHMATGAGKTVIFSEVARRCKGRVLVLAHRGELVDQAARALENATRESVGVEQAEYYSEDQRIVVGSVQTVYREERYKHLQARGGFDTIIIDEGHHYLAPTYKAAVDAFPDAKKLYVSATPQRGDRAAMGQIIDAVAYKFDILDGIKAGYLTPFEGRQVHIQEINLSEVKTTRGDLDQSQLDIQVCKGVASIVSTVLKEWPDRKGIAFFPKKRSARLACERFNNLKPGSAVCVDDDTPKEERKQIIEDCHKGKYQFLCGVMIFTEGFDWPECDLIINARVTKSASLYTQILGRGSRLLKGLVEHVDGRESSSLRRELIKGSAKPNCIIADFAGNAGKHSLCSPVDVLGGDYTPIEVKEAKKLEKEAQKEGEESDPKEHLEEARAKIRALAKLLQNSLVKHSVQKFSPFGVLNMEEPPSNIIKDRTPASESQASAIVRATGLPLKEVMDLSKASANKLLGTLAVRRRYGLASFKQMRRLKDFGISNGRISKQAAGGAMSYLASCGWNTKKVDTSTLRHLCGLRSEVTPTRVKRRQAPRLRRKA